MIQPPEDRSQNEYGFFRDLFLSTAMETYELVLSLDLETMVCTTLLASPEGFRQEGAPEPWEEMRPRLTAAIHPEDREQMEKRWCKALADGRPGDRFSAAFRSTLLQKDGKYAWWTMLGRVLEREGRRAAVMLMSDVTSDMLARQRLLERSERDALTGLYNRSKLAEMLAGRYRELRSCGVVFLDLNGLKETNDNFGHDMGDRMIVLVAESLRRLERTGVTPYRYGGDEFLLITEDVDRDEVNGLVQLWIQGWRDLLGRSELSCSIAVGIAWGEGQPDVHALIEKADGDMYRNKHLMKAGVLPELSSYDSNEGVVGLYGRQDFFKAVRQLLNGSAGRGYCMLSLGIGHFPLVNKWFGRETGDRLLSRIGHCIGDFARDAGGLGCYLESGRFAMFLPAEKGLPDELDEKLRGIVREISPSVGFLLSIGVYPVTDPEMKAFTMLDYAVEAQNRVAANSTRRISFHDRERFDISTLQNDLLGEMKSGLLNGDLDFWLQPVCSPEDRRVVGAEVLARWKHPSWGLMEPERFIPALEAGGLTAELDPVLWERTAGHLRRWMNEGLQPVPAAVIVSRSDILSLDVTAYFRSLAEKYELDHRLLQAVVSAEAMRTGGETAAAITSLREAGFSVLLDISLSPRACLGGIPLPSDQLKMDLRSLPDWASGDRELLRQLVERARELGKPIVVAGAETAEQEALLRALKPDGVQGFRYHRPMPIDDFAALLQKN
jgi:diguanylate cyclase (GGDEF)-like protein